MVPLAAIGRLEAQIVKLLQGELEHARNEPTRRHQRGFAAAEFRERELPSHRLTTARHIDIKTRFFLVDMLFTVGH